MVTHGYIVLDASFLIGDNLSSLKPKNFLETCNHLYDVNYSGLRMLYCTYKELAGLLSIPSRDLSSDYHIKEAMKKLINISRLPESKKKDNSYFNLFRQRIIQINNRVPSNKCLSAADIDYGAYTLSKLRKRDVIAATQDGQLIEIMLEIEKTARPVLAEHHGEKFLYIARTMSDVENYLAIIRSQRETRNSLTSFVV
ncbi:MAG: hypothetical protein AABY00_02035 [Nanoarchaeota archaeon]